MSTALLSQSYFTQRLSNGLTVALLPCKSNVVYCGVAIGTGSRHDPKHLTGLAHLAEHMIFKGTINRKAWHILNRMETVGGELNAFTTKEETFVYTVAPRSEVRRSMDLLSDIVLRATFPAHELEKEREVVADEINLYKDTPAEQIYDDFDALLFPDHSLGHPILGSEESLGRMGREDLLDHARRAFTAQNMVFFCMGQLSPERFLGLCERYFCDTPGGEAPIAAHQVPEAKQTSTFRSLTKHTHQTHTIMGSVAPSMYDARRVEASLLMNYLGGAGMNARLNLLLRERHGWVYNVEGSLTSLSDTGWWQIYYGSDPTNAEKARRAIDTELLHLIEHGLKPNALRAWVKQIKGQLAMSTEQRESRFLNFGKQLLHFGTFKGIDEACRRLDEVSPESVHEVARQIFAPDRRQTLIYEGKEN